MSDSSRGLSRSSAVGWLLVVSAAGLLAAALSLHVAAWAGVAAGLPRAVLPFLHAAILLVFGVSLLRHSIAGGARVGEPFESPDLLRPRWLAVLCGLVVLYATTSWLYAAAHLPGHPQRTADGNCDIVNHGVIGHATAAECDHLEGLEWRMFSGHWLAFACGALALAWPRRPRPSSTGLVPPRREWRREPVAYRRRVLAHPFWLALAAHVLGAATLTALGFWPLVVLFVGVWVLNVLFLRRRARFCLVHVRRTASAIELEYRDRDEHRQASVALENFSARAVSGPRGNEALELRDGERYVLKQYVGVGGWTRQDLRELASVNVDQHESDVVQRSAIF